MKKYSGVPVWIVLTIVTVSLGLSVWALIIANSNVKDDCELIYDYAKVIEFAGLSFTIIGVVFALYFVIIGINANRIKERIDIIDKTVSEKKDQVEKELKKIECDNLDAIYGHLICQAETISVKKTRKRIINTLHLDRARLATRSIFLSEQKRLQRMPDLVQLGDKSDIEDLEKIINDPTEVKTIVELAKVIKEEISKRLSDD